MSLVVDFDDLRARARAIRCDILEMLYHAGSGHPGGSLSMVELLVGLYFHTLRHDPEAPDWADRDFFILSKGHGCPALYAVLAHVGYFERKELNTLRKLGSRLQGHPQRDLPGVEASTGSLGQGLSIANGIAMAAKADNHARRVYCIVGDGEIQEGQIWEAVLTAPHYKLDNLCVMVDANGLQIDGLVEEVKNINPLGDKWRAFGWHVIEIDGHDIEAVINAQDTAMTITAKPTVIIARTVKGKGVSFMENVNTWHGVAPTYDECKNAQQEINGEKI